MDILENYHSLRNGENLGYWKENIFEIALEAKIVNSEIALLVVLPNCPLFLG